MPPDDAEAGGVVHDASGSRNTLALGAAALKPFASATATTTGIPFRPSVILQ